MKDNMNDPDQQNDLMRLTREVANYRRLLDIQRRLGAERDMDALPQAVMSDVSTMLEAERSSLFVFDPRAMEFRASFAQGLHGDSIRVPLEMGLVGASMLSRKLLNVPDANDHPFFNPLIDALSGYYTESVLVVPVHGESGLEVVGAIELLNKHSGRFGESDEAIIMVAAREWAATLRSGGASADAARRLIDGLKETCGCDRGSVFSLDGVQGMLGALYADGADAEAIHLNLRLGIAGTVAVTGSPIHAPDVSADPRFDPSHDQRTGYRTRSLLCVPMNTPRGEILGALQVINKKHGAFTVDDIQTLQSVAGVLAIAIENAMLFADQDKQFHSLLSALAASIDAKDTLTAGHSKRVAQFAVAIARQLGFTERELDVVEVAAILHDYGKIGVDDHVLKKPGKLSPEEYAHIQQHARLTHDILGRIHFARKYRNVPLIASSHHEYPDGSGYPRGLFSREIPFMAKILTVADVFEALTADRHYRKGMATDDAFRILDAEVGRKFDSHIVAALKTWIAENPLAPELAHGRKEASQTE